MFNRILGLMYPDRCIFCKKILDFYAHENKEFTCNICQKKLEYIRGQKCIEKYDNQYFDYLIYAFQYEDIIRKILLDFKFNNKKYLYRFFATEIINTISYFSHTKYDYILYVPISFKKYIERGFNQSYMIAKYVSDGLGIPLLKYGLIKIKHNQTQSTLNISKRRQNVLGVYKACFKKTINDKNILLIDDIYTTGSTLNECSKVLKEAGASNVTVVTIAKAQLKHFIYT